MAKRLTVFTRGVAAALLLMGYSFARAELPVPRLFTVFPPGASVGSKIEVEISGEELDESGLLRFSNPGFSCEAKKTEGGAGDGRHFVVNVSRDVAPGTYEVRLLTRNGFSNSRLFQVGTLNEVSESGPHQSLAAAQVVLLNSVVNGRADANNFDFFRFHARKGERVFIDCAAAEIDSRLEPQVWLFDASGRELGRKLPRDILDFRAPDEGDFIVKVHDVIYGGGAEFFYRLRIWTGPVVDFVFPPVIRNGGNQKVSIYGRAIPGAAEVPGFPGLGRLELDLDPAALTRPNGMVPRLPPKAMAVDALEWSPKIGGMALDPVLVQSVNDQVIVESDPNDTPKQAQKITVPCEFAGRFHPARDRDWVEFAAKKGDVFWIEVFCDRVGVAADPLLVIYRVNRDEKGNEQMVEEAEAFDNDQNIGGVELKTSSADPQRRLEVGSDGVYRIMIRDTISRPQTVPNLVYRLSVRRESPSFRLLAWTPMPPPANKDSREVKTWNAHVRRGATIPIRVLVQRRENFGREIELTAEGLPSFLTATPTTLPSGTNGTLLFLTASERAENWAGPIRIVGRSKSGERDLVETARVATVVWNLGDYNSEPVFSRMSGELFVSVSGVDESPLTILPAEDKVFEVIDHQKMVIPLKIVRRSDFNGAFKLRALGHGLIAGKEVDVPEKAAEAKFEVDLDKVRIPLGKYTLMFETTASGKYRNGPELAAAAEEAAKAAEAEAQKASELAKQSAAAVTSATDQNRETLKKASESAAAAAAQAEARKASLRARANALAQAAQPRDVTATFYSAPMQFQIRKKEK